MYAFAFALTPPYYSFVAPHFHGSKVATVTDTHVREASGLCASHEHPGIIYTHNDSGGNDHRIYAIEAKTGKSQNSSLFNRFSIQQNSV